MTLVRFYRCAALVVFAVAAVAAVACGSESPAAKPDTAEEPDEGAGDGGADGATATDGVTADNGLVGDTPDATGQQTDGGADQTANPDGATDGKVIDAAIDVDAVDVGEGVSGTTDVTGDATKDVQAVNKLELPECAGPKSLDDKTRCANCLQKCGEQPICGAKDGVQKNYFNDCAAICDGVKPTDMVPKPCPKCDKCSFKEVPDKNGFCLTLANGIKINVSMLCEMQCQDFMKTGTGDPKYDGGPCKTKCSAPLASGGGGCDLLKYQPVCGSDKETYASECALAHCDLDGCFPVGKTTKSSTCQPGKLTKLCAGECYDAVKAPDCKDECNPVCGILKGGKAQSFGNACLAGKAGASVGVCDGISATKNDVCSASLYKAKGCCPGVDYSVVNQICASKTVGATSQWVTFRNQGEFDCLTKDDAGWVIQYKGSCICQCTNTTKLVCGADGNTYTNGCQAECYNPGGQFNYSPGACKP